MKSFDSTVWGPHYWFFLHTVANNYPEHPNAVTKRKYYDLIQNMPLFIPVSEMGNQFSKFLDRYPVTPYLDCRESFVLWVHFIHNKFNQLLGKEEISLPLAMDKYSEEYKPKPIYISERIGIKKHYIYFAIIFLLLLFIIIYYE
uniref:thiol oxidase n=1 Tax=viral metagenome TaxID=1070528 RepID=A0A6C0DSX1_9ZZZZ